MGQQKSKQLMEELLDLYGELLIPFMKIRRDIPFPTEAYRGETDGEHAFILSMVAITLAERLELKLDTGLVAKYALIHDLVEVHAGDTSVRADENAHKVKVDREHEAYLIIKDRFLDTATWIPKLIERYEARADEESKFVYATDKLMGALGWMAGGGVGWANNYPELTGDSYYRVLGRLREKAKIYPPLLDLFETIHAELDKRRLEYLKEADNAKQKN